MQHGYDGSKLISSGETLVTIRRSFVLILRFHTFCVISVEVGDYYCSSAICLRVACAALAMIWYGFGLA